MTTCARYKVGEAVDVYLVDQFGWTEGVVEDLLWDQARYRIKTVDLQISSMSPYVEMDFTSPHVVPHRTHCRADWRQHVDHYEYIECFAEDRWIGCRIVRHCNVRQRLLVVFERPEDRSLDSRWFPLDSPCLRYLWDWE